jgi:hypothetical protein
MRSVLKKLTGRGGEVWDSKAKAEHNASGSEVKDTKQSRHAWATESDGELYLMCFDTVVKRAAREGL